ARASDGSCGIGECRLSANRRPNAAGRMFPPSSNPPLARRYRRARLASSALSCVGPIDISASKSSERQVKSMPDFCPRNDLLPCYPPMSPSCLIFPLSTGRHHNMELPAQGLDAGVRVLSQSPQIRWNLCLALPLVLAAIWLTFAAVAHLSRNQL